MFVLVVVDCRVLVVCVVIAFWSFVVALLLLAGCSPTACGCRCLFSLCLLALCLLVVFSVCICVVYCCLFALLDFRMCSGCFVCSSLAFWLVALRVKRVCFDVFVG